MDIEDHFWGIEGPKSTKIPLNALIWVFSVISVLQSGFLGAWTAEYMCSKPWNKHCVQHIIVFLLFPQISPEFLTNFSVFSRSTKSQRYIASRYFFSFFLARASLFTEAKIDMKRRMTWNTKWHETPNDMKRQITWNAKWHETPNDMKRQIIWNAKLHETPNYMKRQITCSAKWHVTPNDM